MMTRRIRLTVPVSRLVCFGESPSVYAYPGDVLKIIGPMAPDLTAISIMGVVSKGMSAHNSSLKCHPRWTCQRTWLSAAACCIVC